MLQCGEPGPPDVTERIVAAHRAEEERRFVERRAALLAWIGANEEQPRARRIRAALAAWDARHWVTEPDRAVERIDFSPALRYASVLRLGEDALPELRARKAAASTDEAAARFELFLAAITGQVDEALVQRLLDSGVTRDQTAALDVIGASRDRRWAAEVDRRQRSTSEDVAALASCVLASLLGRDALPLVAAAARENPRNASAKYVAMELAALPR